MSLGCLAVDSYVNDPLCRAVRRLVDAGVVVVTAAGNNGKDSHDNSFELADTTIGRVGGYVHFI